MKTAKTLSALVPIAAALFLCGCPTTQSSRPGPVTAQGAYVHSASKIILPESIGGFQRNTITRFDADGRDVGVGYNLVDASRHVAATVYVYPAPSLVSIGSPPDVVAEARTHLTEGEFERRKREIQHAHPGAILVEQQDTVRTEGGLSYPGKLAVYEYEDVFADSRMPLRSQLYVFCFVGGKWAVEYRFTWPKTEADDGQIQEFIQKWNWYGTGG